MERDVSVSARILAAPLLVLGLAGGGIALAGEPRLVLVASAKSSITDLPSTTVRHLYLGLPIVQDGHAIVPLRNSADPALQELFLQRVLFMSAQAYERQASARVFRNGGSRVREYAKLGSLVEALTTEPWSVTYMDAETAASLPEVKIVARL